MTNFQKISKNVQVYNLFNQSSKVELSSLRSWILVLRKWSIIFEILLFELNKTEYFFW